jgi:hypothetical protein
MRTPKHLLLAALVAALALAGVKPREASACSWCGSATRCEPANYSRCALRFLKTGVPACESWYENCAWVYDVNNVTPGGTLAWTERTAAPAATEITSSNGRTMAKACGGVVVSRTYTARAEAKARAATSRIVI